MVASIDHGARAPSVLAARTAVSGGASLQGAAAAGLLTLGEFHGAAVESSMLAIAGLADAARASNRRTLDAIADELVAEWRAQGKRVPAFGHRQHKRRDPRLDRLLAVARDADVAGDHVAAALALEGALTRAIGRPMPRSSRRRGPPMCHADEMTTLKQGPRVRTRDRILDVALDMFVEEGFGGTTIIEIERRVGLTPGTGSFYRHFRSKEELLRAAIERDVTRCAAEIAAAHAAAPVLDDPAQARTQELARWLQDLRSFHRLFRLLLSDGDRFPEVRRTIQAAIPRVIEGPPADRNPVDVVATAALLGYQLLGQAWGRPYLNLDEDEFIAVLAGMTEQPTNEE